MLVSDPLQEIFVILSKNMKINSILAMQALFKACMAKIEFFAKEKSLDYIINYFAIRGGSLKKIAKKIMPNVPISKKV